MKDRSSLRSDQHLARDWLRRIESLQTSQPQRACTVEPRRADRSNQWRSGSPASPHPFDRTTHPHRPESTAHQPSQPRGAYQHGDFPPCPLCANVDHDVQYQRYAQATRCQFPSGQSQCDHLEPRQPPSFQANLSFQSQVQTTPQSKLGSRDQTNDAAPPARTNRALGRQSQPSPKPRLLRPLSSRRFHRGSI